MFPDYLDGAKVIEYTERSSLGITVDPWDNENPDSEKEVCYIAVCQYEGSAIQLMNARTIAALILFGLKNLHEFEDTAWYTVL